MNIGTSYLVAPLYTQKRGFKDIFSKASSFLQQRNQGYIKKQTVDDEEPAGEGEGTPEAGEKKAKKAKKSIQTIKTEQLQRLFDANVRG